MIESRASSSRRQTWVNAQPTASPRATPPTTASANWAPAIHQVNTPKKTASRV